jgi:light-regulated signal transduction histidine kinase (bacteriophytochrome)
MPDPEKLSAELEATKKDLDALNYAVSHDLRAPLRIIEGFSEALVDDYRDKLDAQALDYLLRVREAAARMEQLINGLLDLSRVTRAPLTRETVDISDMAESIATGLKASDSSRKVEFSIQPGVTMEGDPVLLRVALDHLLKNSWKFTRKHPAARIEVGTEKRDGQQLLYVRDDGAGFDPIYASRMFQPFQRFHSVAEFEGTGIGLAMVQRIVHRHGGKVWAVGKVEEGTTVYIELG